MAITRWQPFGEIESWQNKMNRLFGIDFMPAAEMEETDNEIVVKLEIPGMEASDLDIQVTETSITIGGERKEETKIEEKAMVRSEFSYGKFERIIPLSAHIQNDKVKAEYKNGILILTLPKTEAEKHKIVKIKVA